MGLPWWLRGIPIVCADGGSARAPVWAALALAAYWPLFFLAVGTGLTGLLLRRPRRLWLGVGGVAGLSLPAILSVGPLLLLGAAALAAAGLRAGRPSAGDILAAAVAAVLLPAFVLGTPLAVRAFYCGAG